MKKLNLILLALAASVCANAADLNGLKIYINPGHGGHDSDDRNVAVPPFSGGDPEGFWESNTNLTKGLYMRDMLQGYGTNVMMSRVTNTTADDRNLTEIGVEATNYAADFFFSIHSNATGTESRVNAPLMLYRGFDNDPVFPEAKVMSEILNKHLLENQIASWSHPSINVRGDYDFYNWGVGVGLGVLRNCKVPSMLSEGSHHDYIPETYRLLNTDYCWLEGYHFVKAVMEYFNSSEKFTTGVVAGTAYDSRMVRTEDIYSNIFYGHDKSKPLCGATVELVDASDNVVDTYTTDQYFNGMFLFKSVAPGEYKLRVSHPEYRPYEGAVTVTANNVSYLNPAVNRIRNTAPKVEAYSPQWTEGGDPISCNTPVRITFNWDMDTESVEKAFSITPAVEGKVTWEDSQYVLVFTPKKVYEKNTVYTVKVAKTAKHPENIEMGEDFVFSFKTKDYNEYEVVLTNPQENAKVHYQSPFVQVLFPTHPNTLTIQDEITVTDKSGAKLEYNLRSKKFSKLTDPFGFFQIKLSGDLVAGETYNLNIAGTVCDAEGIPVAQGMKVPFTAVDASVDNESFTTVETFEDAGLLVKNTEKTVNTKTFSAAKDTSNEIEGAACWKMTYTVADVAADGKTVFDYAGAAPALDGSKTTNIRVYGDMSLNDLKCIVAVGDTETEVALCNMDFLGWQVVSIPANTVNGNYTIKGFAIEHKGDNKYGAKGTVYVDKIATGIADDGGVESVELATVRVYPNPASELLIANADMTIYGIELLTLDGKLISAVSGNVMNVSSVADGVYVAKIHTANGFSVKKVAVKH